ncbi:MAG: TonB-dependent receptor plug domain-containing protein [candidate division WOR-3 bacterium]
MISLLFLNSDTTYTLPEVEVKAKYYKKVENTKTSYYISENEFQNLISSFDKIEEKLIKIPTIAFEGKDAHGAVPAIRGFSRYRTIALLDGYRIATDREIGPSAYFSISDMFEGIEVLEGSGASSFGSGAIGGSVIYYLRGVNSKNEIDISYGTNGNNYKVFAGLKPINNFYIAGGFNSSENYFYPDTSLKEKLWTNSFIRSNNSSFKKFNVLSAYKYKNYEFKLGYFRIIDLYRAMFSSAIRLYPKDEQIYFITTSENLTFGFHYYNFISRTIKTDTSDAVYNGYDLGLTYNYKFLIFDYFGRINVNSKIYKNSVFQYDELKNAGYNNFGITAFYSNKLNKLLLSYALRIGIYNQENNFNFSPSGHIGLNYKINNYLYTRGNIQFAYRFPELVETKSYVLRTRGFVIGNEKLSPEKALNNEIIIGVNKEFLSFEIGGFYSAIWDFIEMTKEDTLTSSGDTIFTYKNLNGISNVFGISLGTRYKLNNLLFTLNYAFMEGKGELEGKEIELSDIPPSRIFLGINYKFRKFLLDINSIYSFAKKGEEVSPIEAERPSYLMLNVGISFLYNENLKFSIIGNNINNVVAYRSLDPNSMPLPSRNIKFQLDYTF